MEAQNQDTVEGMPDWTPIPIYALVTELWRRRVWVGKVTAVGTVLTLGVALLIPDEYTSTVQLMPPDPQSLSSPSMLNSALVGAGTGLTVPSVASGLMSQRTPGATSIGILGSRTVLDDIINRFDLRRVYHDKLYVDARKNLMGQTSFTEDKKSGMIVIAVTDRDRYRARDIAQAYVEELDRLLNSLSTSSARRERIFLEQRLKTIKEDLDASSLALSKFSSRNATLDLQKQGEATVEAAGRLQGELIAAQSELSGLRAMYADDNVRVREVRGRIDELQSQLQKMSGEGKAASDVDLSSGQMLPSIRQLPLLGFTYYDLYRQVTIQETLYESLTKQYEMAKVEEAKEIPPIKVLDEPDVPERKSSPHRLTMTLVGGVLSAFVGIVWVVGERLRKIVRNSDSTESVGPSENEVT
jgi:capsule polysaccharide export protein KpsE/RkpR